MENRLGSNHPNRKLEFPDRTSDSLTLGRDATCCLNWAISGSETQIIRTANVFMRFISTTSAFSLFFYYDTEINSDCQVCACSQQHLADEIPVLTMKTERRKADLAISWDR